MIKFLTFFCLLVSIMACNSHSGVEKFDSDSSTATHVTAESAATKKPISTDSGSLIQVIEKPAMLLFGQQIEVEYNQIYATLQLVTPAIIRQISNAGAVMTGPVVFLYESIPANTEVVVLFVGIPVKNKFKNEGETTFKSIPKANYYRMDCNAEAGNTKEHHIRMQRVLEHQGLAYSAPVIELVSESRNNEMTVVSKASLLYSKK